MGHTQEQNLKEWAVMCNIPLESIHIDQLKKQKKKSIYR